MEGLKDFVINSGADYLDIVSFEEVDARKLVRYLRKNLHIKTLYLRNCSKIQREKFIELSLNKNLVSISITIVHADDESINALPEMTNLTSLILEEHCLTCEGIKALSKFTYLTKLATYQYKIEVDEESAKKMASVYIETLAKLTNLTELNLKDSFASDELIKLLVNTNCFPNFKHSESNVNNVENLAASTESLILPNLTHLILQSSNISFSGAKELLAAPSKWKSLQEVDLRGSALYDIEIDYIEELSKITYSREKLSFELGDNYLDGFHNLLRKVLANKITMDEALNGDELSFNKRDPEKRILKYLLTQTEKYQLRLNSTLESGYSNWVFDLGKPGAEKDLFELGALPAALPSSRNQETALKDMTCDAQSVHLTPVVKKTNFFTQYLVDSMNTTKNQLEQIVQSFTHHIPSLLQRFQSDPIRVKLLNLTAKEKACVMETTLCGRPLPSDKEFVESVIRRAKIFLDEKYYWKGNDYSTSEFQFDYTLGEAKVTIPQCIGYIKLLIDTFDIPLNEKAELLVTLMERNPKSKLKKENMNRSELYELVKNMTHETMGQLFTAVSGLNIEDIWREQKEFVLLKQIYISATAYGEDNAACLQGIWCQIIASLDEIDLKLLSRYEQHLDRQRDLEKLMTTITRDNSSSLATDLAQKLIEFAAFRPRARKSLEEFVFGLINQNNLKQITFEQQQIFAQLNREFLANVKRFLPNYEREIPTVEEYDILIEGILKSKPLQDFAKGPSPGASNKYFQ